MEMLEVLSRSKMKRPSQRYRKWGPMLMRDCGLPPGRMALMCACFVLYFVSFLVGCSDDKEPQTGYTDPCATPLAGPLGCPLSRQIPSSDHTIFDACSRLVDCGILSAEYFKRTEQGCINDLECGSGKCLTTKDNQQKCYYHYLDYLWCVNRFSSIGADPCAKDKNFNSGDLSSAVFCIMTTPCNALGLPFALKLDPAKNLDSDAQQDTFMCQNGKYYIATATTCEQGILDYWSQEIK